MHLTGHFSCAALLYLALAGSHIQEEEKLNRLLENLMEKTRLPSVALLETLDRSKDRTASNNHRRRTVSDRDCDSVQDKIDSVEQTCAVLRYSVLQTLTPAIQYSIQDNTVVQANLTVINTTLHGSETDASDNAYIQKVFENQRDMLYGPGGTCLDPQPGGLSYGADSLSSALATVHQQLTGTMDTNWRNMLNLDSNVSAGFINATKSFSYATQNLLEAVNKGQSSMFAQQGKVAASSVKWLNQNLSDLSTQVNELQGNLTQLISDATRDASQFHNDTDPPLNNLLDLVDQLADEFIGVDGLFSKSIETLAAQLSPVLSSQPGKAASDPIKAISNRNAQYIASFKDSSTGEIENSWADWNKTFNSNSKSADFDLQQKKSSLSDAQSGIDQQLADASSTILSDITKTQSHFSSEVRDLLALGKDARNVIWATTSKLRNVKGSLDAMYSSLDGVSGQAADQLRKQLASLLSSKGEASSNQLRSVLQQFSSLQSKLGGSNSIANNQLASAIANIKAMVGSSGVGRAGTGADAQRIISTNRDYSQQITSSAGHSMQSVVGGASAGLLTAADSNAAALNEGSKVFSESLSSASSDARDAISGGSDAVHAATTATDMERSHASSSVISTLSKNGSLVQASAKNAGRSLNVVENTLATSLTSLGAVSDNMNKASAQSAGSASSLGVSIGSFDSGIADQFNQQSAALKASTGNDVDKAIASAGAFANRQAADLTGQVSGMQSQSDAAESAGEHSLFQGEEFNDESIGDIASFSSGLDSTLRGFQVAGKSANDSIEKSLRTASIKAIGPASTFSSEMRRAAADAQTQAESQADSAVKQKVNGYKSVVAGIMNQAGRGSASVDPTVVKNLVIMRNGEDSLKAAMKTGRAQLDSVETQLTASDLEDNSAISSIQNLMHRILHQIEKDFSNLSSSVNASMSDLPSQFPDGIDGAIRKIIDDLIEEDNKFHSAYASMEMSAANESSSSSRIVGDLEQTTDSFQANLLSAQANAAKQSAHRVNLLSSIADGAGGVANLVSLLDGSVSKSNSKGKHGAATSGMTLQSMISGLQSALAATNGSLGSESSSSQAQSLFNGRLSSSQASRLLQSLQEQAGMVKDTAKDAQDGLSAGTGEGAMNIAGMESSLRQDDAERTVKIAKAMARIGGVRSDFAQNVTGNKDAVAVQLMMARRAVRDLLSSWSSYTEYETKKFKKMSSTDQEYVSMSNQRLDSQSEESQSNLTSSQAGLSTISGDIRTAIEDYVEFQNSTGNQLGLLSQVIPALNNSAQASITQLGHSMQSLDDQDRAADLQARGTSLEEISNFEASLDQNAQMVLSAANGDLLSVITAR